MVIGEEGGSVSLKGPAEPEANYAAMRLLVRERRPLGVGGDMERRVLSYSWRAEEDPHDFEPDGYKGADDLSEDMSAFVAVS